MKWIKHLKNVCGRAPSYLWCDNAAWYINSLKDQLAAEGTTTQTKMERPSVSTGPLVTWHAQCCERQSFQNTTGVMPTLLRHTYTIGFRTPGLRNPLCSHCSRSNQIRTDCIHSVPDRAIPHVPKEKRDKLDERGEECLLLGYPSAGSGWLFLHPENTSFTPHQRCFLNSKSCR